jgi:glycosyltransferase involved in cell wall biosynthesis
MEQLARADVIHLHHLTPLHGAATLTTEVPIVTTLHGTELKFLDAARRRQRLAAKLGMTLAELAMRLRQNGSGHVGGGGRFAAHSLTDDERALLRSTRWQVWPHADHWVARLLQYARRSDQIVAVSEYVAAEAERLLPGAQDAIPITNGVDADHFRPRLLTPARRQAVLSNILVKRPHGWLPGRAPGSLAYEEADLTRLTAPDGRARPVIMFIGRFLAFKRLCHLIRAFALARQRLNPAPVLLIWGGYPGEWEGEHPYDAVVSARIEHATFFAGWRSHEELPPGLACADLMVAPSVDEPLGLVYLEALACGVPVIATDTGGAADLIRRTGGGWLVPPDDVRALADLIEMALADLPRTRRIGTAGSAYVRQTYGWATVAAEYESVYEEAIAQHRQNARSVS